MIGGIDINLQFRLRSSTRMGAFCSKAGTHEGGHQVIGTTQKLGGEGVKGDPAKAGLEAAEKRKKEVGLPRCRWRCGRRGTKSWRLGRSNEGGRTATIRTQANFLTSSAQQGKRARNQRADSRKDDSW